MTNELDRAIDTAAHELIAREPSRTLGYNVMARVRGGDMSAPHSAWLKAACVCAAGLVVAYLAIHRPVPVMPTTHTPQVARTEPMPLPVPPVEPARETHAEVGPLPRPRIPAVVRRAPVIPPPAVMGVAPVEPIKVEPIAAIVIDVPRIVVESTSIEPLIIEPLTIEPLAASND